MQQDDRLRNWADIGEKEEVSQVVLKDALHWDDHYTHG